MIYQHVCLEAVSYKLPEEIVSSAQIEAELAPLYRRLRLPEGRLELMTGIRERRFWPRGTQPGQMSVLTAQAALESAAIDPRQIGALIHASVCRDYLEPATACGVHRRLALPRSCLIYDVSNACLGILNGMVQLANMLELGQIRAGIVVGTESSRAVVENTIHHLNADSSATRNSVKRSFASLTLGSASSAVVLVHRDLSRTKTALLSAVARADTAGHELCRGGDESTPTCDAGALMNTNSEQLMHDGIALGAETFELFLKSTGWQLSQVDGTFCHQVGLAHRRLMLAELGLDPALDFSTVEWLGNTGSVAVPLGMALGAEAGRLKPDDRLALLGIGSGINTLMMAAQWQPTTVDSDPPEPVHRPNRARIKASS